MKLAVCMSRLGVPVVLCFDDGSFAMMREYQSFIARVSGGDLIVARVAR